MHKQYAIDSYLNRQSEFFFSNRRMQRTKAEQQLRVMPAHLGVGSQDDEEEEEGKPGENKEGSKSEQARMRG